jgi:hypothetical protein
MAIAPARPTTPRLRSGTIVPVLFCPRVQFIASSFGLFPNFSLKIAQHSQANSAEHTRTTLAESTLPQNKLLTLSESALPEKRWEGQKTHYRKYPQLCNLSESSAQRSPISVR